MTLPYLLRLLCLCSCSFFLLNAAAVVLLRAFSERVLRLAETREPAEAARLLLAVRLLPCAISALFVFGFCVPSYLRLEAPATSEYAGTISLALGLLGLTTFSLSLIRAGRALCVSMRYARRIRQAAGESSNERILSRILVLESESPVLALFGLFRSHLLVSRSLLNVLSPEELDAAVSHEHAHRVSRDNLKRLLILLAPDALPFTNALGVIEQAWYKLTEWAADDLATGGNPVRAVSLASALVRLARLGSPPALPYLTTSLLASDHDLQARVDRLLDPASARTSRPSPANFFFRLAAISTAVSLAVFLVAPWTLSFVHEFQELLLR